jgi:hypothetical protein
MRLKQETLRKQAEQEMQDNLKKNRWDLWTA